MMIIWYLTIWTESYLHISHLIFDIIHPSLLQGDRRSRAANGKNRFDNSILIHYILLHARGRACFESKMTRWFPRGRVYLTRRESGVISSHSRHNMHTLLSSRSSQIQDTHTQSFSRHNFPPRRGLSADIQITRPWLTLRTLRTNREELETFHEGSEI